MDVFEVIKGRRSCRKFSAEAVSGTLIEKILEAGIWAPSPLNSQPWQFIVVTQTEIKDKIFSEAERCRDWALEKSGWKWLEKYKVDFLKSAPVIIAVTGDPKKTGLDMYMEGGGVGYQHACAAAVQNMILAAHALGLGSLWFTLFDKEAMREILGIEPDKVPLALVCIGKTEGETPATPRKEISAKVRHLA